MLREGPDGSAADRPDESPGTVLMGDEDDTEAPEPITELYGRDGLYMLQEDFGEPGGVIAKHDLSRGELPPPVVMGEVLADMAANPFTDTGSGALFPGEASRFEETGTWYWVCCTTVFIGEEIVRQERMGEAMSLADLTEEAGDPGMFVLMGEAEVMDQTDFSGEALGVLEDELEREPNPVLAWLGTATGTADHA